MDYPDKGDFDNLYTEAQVHGGVHLRDISHVLLHKGGDDYIKSHLKGASIPFRDLRSGETWKPEPVAKSFVAILHKAQPTPAQAEAGNYKKEHINLFGFNISIENKAGTYRTGTGKDGTQWKTLMCQDYGYIRGYEDKDGDAVDVFIGKNRRIPFVYVIDQKKSDGTFDEHKCVFGAKNETEAEKMYNSNYERGWDRCGAVTKMSIPAFKAWLKGGGGVHPVALLKAIGEAR
jgi:hypothetical protein